MSHDKFTNLFLHIASDQKLDGGTEPDSSLAAQTLMVGRESGQFPIIILFLTHQGFLGVLIRLVTNGGAQLPFWHVVWRDRKPAFAERIPIYVHTYFIRCAAAEYAIQKPDGNLTRLSLPRESLGCETNQTVYSLEHIVLHRELTVP